MRVLNNYFGKTLFKDINRSAYQKFINEYGKNHAKSTVLKVNAIIRGFTVLFMTRSFLKISLKK